MTAPTFAHPPEPWVEADLDAQPDDGNRYEIIEGRLIVTPPANDRHGAAQLGVGAAVRGVLPNGYVVLAECGIRVPGGNVIADVAVLTPYARRGVVWRDAGDVALVVEVASPTTQHYDATEKLDVYLRARIPSYWRVEQDGTVHVYSFDIDRYDEVAVVRPGEEWEADEPFPVKLRPGDFSIGGPPTQ